jgi:hypothetical protein
MQTSQTFANLSEAIMRTMICQAMIDHVCNSDSNLLSSEGVDAFGWAVLPGNSGTPVGGWRTGVQGFPYNQVCENSVAPVELSWVSSFF